MTWGQWVAFWACCSTSLWIYIISFVLVTYAASSTFRFYIKCLCLMLYYACVITIAIIISICSPWSRNNLHKASRAVNGSQKIWGIKYNLKGVENVKESSNYIILSNHQSFFDINVVSNLIPPNTTFVAKKAALYVPFFGLLFWLSGMYFIDRKNHSKAMEMMNKVSDQIAKEKFNLWIFPEGTRRMGNKLLPFKKGAFHLAQQLQLPILPIVISNYSNIINFKERRFTTGTIDITILPEVSTKCYQSSDVQKLIDTVHLMMSKEFEKCPTTQL